ncbi:MAG: protoporphyrinogen oxidase [Candidatus Muproteobacteria bacterium RIFCSPHIGHO2_12_FULL_60_33]|uniref:Protoporphyrinogen oxidase n=1 Tax=Candidatus Muproteobacteria bacterium RIFCSPLOWO2_01_FULL_60_18 TaxID=1817768 RepID=A0A1F6TXE1_9PROT|nr:MAG: protoporphyrinogen oxidase [Candidatus Muproteobacteria bacterium RIFCSPHIGHO2_01_60_12]OGI49761.1 MAG: protoporphyrinogen oxidase [Candidatus Muproteobacteria bacterium RIFCSPLOWO2_01_FULL_60_18]OGI53355.1 MAG: protoporphyrinogen oxidase [Candidatus Muproteobacteria bacterium RIFCSPHIGHO2_12_FULL_60_33]OGI54054.1 MAG: protoporphyrinogen oxidase [Candidatus Muproteobacteria bacterium RIFCSPHIGHO2_02_FULL_60_13]OGI59847.1 MAG: protoporphyrinogen oxidase [Candidatus Muproteobacteria bacte
MSTQTDVLIVGGGVSGLSIAWWLAQAGLPVEVWEADARPGGKIESHRQDGYLTERAASLLMNFRPEVTEMVREAGLEEEKIGRSAIAESRRYLWHAGRLQTLPMQLGSMIVSPIWSWRGKLRLLAEPFLPAGGHEDESVSEFIRRRLGREMLDKAMEPFIAGTLAADPDLTSASAALPRLTALERRYGSLTAGILAHRLLRRRTACRADTFSFHDGMETLIKTLAATPGVCLHTRHRLLAIERGRDGWEAVAATPLGERRIRAKELVLATPAGVSAALVQPLDVELAQLLNGIRYAPIKVVHLGFDRAAVGHALDGTGFLVPRNEGLPLTGNLWMSSLFANRAPAGKVLLTAYLGGARTPGVADWTDTRVVDETLGVLRRVLGIRGEPELVRLDHHAEALPLYHGAYQARIRAIGERLEQTPGLHLEANYRGGVSVRDRIYCARTVAGRIRARAVQAEANLKTAHALSGLA